MFYKIFCIFNHIDDITKNTVFGGHLVNTNMAATDICANGNIGFLSP